MKRPDTFTEVEPVTNADAIRSISCADVLRRREHPVVLFTPALLFTHAGFDRDPVVEFNARFPAESKDLQPFFIALTGDKSFFRGLGSMPLPGQTQPVNWDQRLYCIDARRKAECFAFLGGIAFSHPATQYFASTFSYEIAVPDPTAAVADVLPVTVFGAATSRGIFFLRERLLGKQPIAQRIAFAEAAAQLPPAIKTAVFLSGFNGVDPLTMRDD